MSEKRMNKLLLLILYVCTFILLREWLIPVMMLTQTGGLALFLYFILLSFSLKLLGGKWWLSLPLKALYIFWAIHPIYLETIIPSFKTANFILQDLLSNLSIILSGDMESISNPFRTILFFVLLWMAAYLLSYWIETKKTVLFFYISTVIFIAVIDTFTAYSASGAIIRIMVTGLLLIGYIYIIKLADRHATVLNLKTLVTMSIPLLLIVIISVLFVVLLPKHGPVWPDPVPYLQAAVDSSDKASDSGIAKSGYDPDDSTLGGPFLEDDTLVFESVVDKKQYWKIETKNTYTSKGWAPMGNSDVAIYSSGSYMGEYVSNGNIENEENKIAEIKLFEQFPFLIYPYGMTKANTVEDITFRYLKGSGHYLTEVGDESYALQSYEVEYIDHDFSLKALRATTMDSFNEEENNFIDYLQLPGELPTRVAELALTITESSESVYDKTKAIERYYGSNGFRYDREKVAIPGGDDDYVDQFLFDTKIGYCDNFSTSMVVMLRTIGIPARWVKGFAPGELGRNANDERVYQITNNEAHSWVEAYMPGIGWMPFEPTIGFSGPAGIDYDIELEANDPEIEEMPEQKRLELEKTEKIAEKKEEFDLYNALGSLWPSLRGNQWLVLVMGVGIGLIIFCGVLYGYRRKWIPQILVLNRSAQIKNWATFEKKFKILLKQLERCGIKRQSGETLSTYAARVDEHLDGQMMREFTKAFEKGIYGEDKVSHDWQRLQEMWEHLVINTVN